MLAILWSSRGPIWLFPCGPRRLVTCACEWAFCACWKIACWTINPDCRTPAMVSIPHHYNLIKYLLSDMLNYHCLRVFRSRVRRIGKHSPRFSVFRTRVHGCSDAELCRISIQCTVGAIFLLRNYWISIGHARQVINEVWRFRVTDGVEWRQSYRTTSSNFADWIYYTSSKQRRLLVSCCVKIE